MEQRGVSWRATAVAVALTSRTAFGWLSSGTSFGISSSSVRTVGRGGFVSSHSTASAWTTPRALVERRAHQSRSGGAGGVSMQVWSNPQAVQDYKDLLDGKAPEDKFDGPSVIIGKGKLGTALYNMGMGEDVMLGRGEGIPDVIPATSGKGEEDGAEDGMLKEFPIYVCVPEHEVGAVIDICPPQKRADMVFLSSGCLEPLLKSKGMCRGEQTQVVLYFSIDKVGSRPNNYRTTIGTDGRGEPKLAGETAACGKWRGAIAMRLGRSEYDIPCSMVFYLDWRRCMFEKLIFDSAVNLVGGLHKFKSVGYVVEYHTEELTDMLFELKKTLRGTLAVSLMDGYPERLLAYGNEVADDKTTRMDPETFKWYNKFFLDISQLAIRKDFPDPCPMHTEYLNYGVDKGILRI